MKCYCGCGEDAPIADRNDRKRGRVKGEPLRFVQGHNRRKKREPAKEKTCSSCGQRKAAEEFYGDASKADGLSSRCRGCVKKDSASWYKAHPDIAKASNAKWRAANPEKYRASQERWDRAHKAERAEVENRRRTRKRGNGRVEKIDPWFIFARDGGKCHICGKRVAKKDMSLDHIIPISKKGAHVATNVRLAHLACNVKRGAGRTPAQLLLL